MNLREKIYDQVWNTYQDYIALVNNRKSLPVTLFPIEITGHYKTLHQLLTEYKNSGDFHIFDIASFFDDIYKNKYLEKLHGVQTVPTGTKIAFFKREYIGKMRQYLIELDSKNGSRRYQFIGDDKMIIHFVRSQKEHLQLLFDYILLDPEPNIVTYFYLIGNADGFPQGYEIGSGKLYHFQELPRIVKDSWRYWKNASKYIKLEEIETKDKEKKYPEIIAAILETLFPRFFRDIIKEEYMNNVTITSNLSR